MKTIAKILGIGAITLASLIGCKNAEPYFEKNVAKYNGYDVMIHKGQITIGTLENDDPNEGFGECLTAYFDSKGNLSGEVIFKVKKGSYLEKSVSFEKLNEIFREVNERRRQ